jgi:hydroxyacylglutathione hydrolase
LQVAPFAVKLKPDPVIYENAQAVPCIYVYLPPHLPKGHIMPLILETIPCLADNYAYLVHDTDSGQTALIDAPEAPPILARLAQKGWTLGQIFITHHHSDHIDGVADLVAATGAQVLGAAADAHRLPVLNTVLSEGDTVQVGAHKGRVLDVSGHTIGHIAFVFDGAGEEGETLAFTADSLMAAGCGRLFEGTPDQMWTSLQKLAALPDDPVALFFLGRIDRGIAGVEVEQG